MRDRGFKLMDTNVVAKHMVNYGEEWMPMWEYEQTLAGCLKESPSLTDEVKYPALPWQLRYGLPVQRLIKKVARRLRLTKAAAL
jgi:hypothetical protein